MPRFREKLRGALYGVAIGDAMGAPVEGKMPDAIRHQFGDHDLLTFLPPTHGGDPDTGKGNGRITDDTLMTEALIKAYIEAEAHLDAYGYVEYLLPHVRGTPVWVPERQQEMDLWDRLWFPEKYPWMRLTMGNVDPRRAGVGNAVNCGIAMWMMPVGAVNAGSPEAAYQEAAAIGIAHNESYAVEAGAVMAAAAARAFAPDATVESVLDTSQALARDGTRNAIAAAVGAAEPGAGIREFIDTVRRAVRSYDPREGHVPDDSPLLTVGLSDVNLPSRIHAIEELPVALAALKYGAGDFNATLEAAVRYGRDCDSTAGMACALFGAIFGLSHLTPGLVEAVDPANCRDFRVLADRFTDAIYQILEDDQLRATRRVHAIHSI